MTTYKELKERAAALEKQIAQARESEFGDALAKVRRLVSLFGFSRADVFEEKAAKHRQRSDKRAKFRDPNIGVEWSGLGREPQWIKGKDREQIRIV